MGLHMRHQRTFLVTKFNVTARELSWDPRNAHFLLGLLWAQGEILCHVLIDVCMDEEVMHTCVPMRQINVDLAQHWTRREETIS